MTKRNASAYHILTIIILSGIFLVALCLIVFLKPTLREGMQKLIVFPYMVFEMIITPIVYGVGAAVVLSILTIWKDLKIQNRIVRRLLLVCSTVLIILYIFGVIYFIMTFNNVGYPIFCLQVIEWLLEYPIVFSVLGIVFFCAITDTIKNK